MRVLAHGTPTQKEDSSMSAFTIYEKHPTADAYRVGGFYSPYALVSQDKKFSDAELAAEYWMSVACEMPFKETSTLLRFRKLPHFDA